MELTRASLAGLLNRRVIDATGRVLGHVRELEIDGATGEQPRVVALLVGRRGIWSRLHDRPARDEDRIAWGRVRCLDARGRLVVEPDRSFPATAARSAAGR